MSATQFNPTDATQFDPMVARHAELVGQYDVTTGAPKAGVARKISELELDMTLADVSFTPWAKPQAYTTRYILSEDELREEIAKLQALMARTNVRESIKHTADRRLAKLRKQAGRREITV